MRYGDRGGDEAPEGEVVIRRIHILLLRLGCMLAGHLYIDDGTSPFRFTCAYCGKERK